MVLKTISPSSERKVPGCTYRSFPGVHGTCSFILYALTRGRSFRWTGCKWAGSTVLLCSYDLSCTWPTTIRPISQKPPFPIWWRRLASLTSAITPWTAEAHLAALITAVHLKQEPCRASSPVCSLSRPNTRRPEPRLWPGGASGPSAHCLHLKVGCPVSSLTLRSVQLPSDSCICTVLNCSHRS